MGKGISGVVGSEEDSGYQLGRVWVGWRVP